MENITLNQIAYEIFEIVRGHISDDEDISIEMIKDSIHDVRSMLLKQKFDKNIRVIENVYTQSLGSVEIEPVDSSVHPIIQSGRYLYRTVREIPDTISRNNYEGTFTRIGPADSLSTDYSFVSYNRALVSGNGKFNKDQVYAFLKDNKIHIISSTGKNHKGIQFIEIIGVFENPKQVAMFTDVAGNSMYSDDGRYPISRTMKDAIVDILLKTKYGISIQAKSDNINDGTNE